MRLEKVSDTLTAGDFHVTCCYMNKAAQPKRPYRQLARAAAAQDTENDIISAFRDLLSERFYDEITLDDVAAVAGTTRQTIIRRFGNKSGVLTAFTQRIGNEIEAHRAAAASGSVPEAARILVSDYETTGEMVIRLLALEGRIADIEPTLEAGRAGHRKWVETTFGRRLQVLDRAERRDRISQLLVVTDVWTWFLLRKTQKKSVPETTRLIASMIDRFLQV
jgi:AcrR family transcriptional regulator